MRRAKETETKSHFDFGLFGNLNGSEYSNDEGKKSLQYAYYRDELKANGLQPRYPCTTRGQTRQST